MAEELQTYLLEHFQWLHRHPELALKEYETTNYVKNVLKQTEGVELLNLGLDTGALAMVWNKATWVLSPRVPKMVPMSRDAKRPKAIAPMASMR